MTFLWPMALWSVLAAALVVVAYVMTRRGGPGVLGPAQALDGSAQHSALRTRWGRHVPIAVFATALAVLGVGAARPVAVLDLPRSEGTVIVAFDTSTSMLADDVLPSRIERATQLAVDFVEEQPDGIRIGVVSFGSGGLILQTPTDDSDAVIEAIGRVGAGGDTSLGRGLFTALDAIDEVPISLGGDDDVDGDVDGDDAAVEPVDVDAVDIGYFGSAVIVFFSDGEDTSDLDPLDVATIASNAGVSVYPVGVGTLSGTVIEVDGFTLATALDDATLLAISERTDGAYSAASGDDSEDADLASLFDRVDRELVVRGDETELTGLFAAVAGVLLLMGAAFSMVRFGRAP